jgi:hypothetical protein
VDPNETVIVVGTGPSLASGLEALRRVRDHVRLFTSPRGAEALLRHGIVPDLVLIEHQTALDAHHSARHAGDTGHQALALCPLVAADWRTPRAMLTGISAGALYVPGSCGPGSVPTWGLWPATAAAMAVEAGAARIALLGIDLGTSTDSDPAHAPLRAVLELLASLVTTVTFDCGGGARKRGWRRATLDQIAGVRAHGRLEAPSLPAAPEQARVHDAEAGLAALAPVIERAARLEALALQARSAMGDASARSLRDGMEEVLGWRHDPRVRILLQECLGVSFLPRFWRTGVDLSLGPALWRPLLLATHELTAQAGTLASLASPSRSVGAA